MSVKQSAMEIYANKRQIFDRNLIEMLGFFIRIFMYALCKTVFEILND